MAHRITALLIIGIVLLMFGKSYGNSLDGLRGALPDKIKGWVAEPEDRIFDRETIFDYIDGAGEVYRAYNMQRCLSRRYIRPNGPAIVLDIFDMGTSKDAFGVFTHDQDGEALDLGQDALYRSGWLSFWKDRFFVSIYAEEETATSQKTIGELGKVVASLITVKGLRPQILSKLPPQGLQPKSTRYLHHHVVLNYHFYLADRNILNLGSDMDAALGEYQRGHKRARLFVATYPSAREAEKALASFLESYLPEANSTGIVLLENGKWSGAAIKGKVLVAVFEAESPELARSLLKEVTETSSEE